MAALFQEAIYMSK